IRTPKPSLCNNSSSYNHLLAADMNVQTTFTTKDLDMFYNDFKDRRDTVDEGKAKKRNSNKRLNGSYMKFSKAIPAKNYGTKRREDYEDNRKNKAKNFLGWQQNSSRDEGKRWLVEQQLKELELMDISNVDHVLDIEEILHYYSRLTCPAYLDIVDKFLMDIYAEFLGPPGTPCSVNSRQTTLLPSL
ncbi:hypothetical protein MANES_03G020800v8, partial [Manihot esculenta]